MNATTLVYSIVCAWCLPSSGAEPGGTVRLDVAYVADGGHHQQLDLYVPEGAGFATVLYLHEGGLTGGDRKDEPYAEIALNFQQAGIAFANANYRLFPDHPWPAPAQDAAAAFAWLKSHIADEGGDPDRIFVCGHSSGALLTAVLSTDDSFLRTHGLMIRDIKGAVVMGTLLHDTFEVGQRLTPDNRETIIKALQGDDYCRNFAQPEDWINHWPIEHVQEVMPPILVLMGEEEQFQPPLLDSARRFVHAAEAAGAAKKTAVVVLPNRRHYTAMNEMANPDDPTLKIILDFVRSGGTLPASTSDEPES